MSALPPWYFGQIKRIEAEYKLLSAENEHGAFLIRDSETHAACSLSIRDGDTVKHYLINHGSWPVSDKNISKAILCFENSKNK